MYILKVLLIRFALGVAVLLPVHSWAQSPTQSWPLRISLLDETFGGIGFYNLSFPYHPAFTVGTDYLIRFRRKQTWNPERRGKWLIRGELGGYYHAYIRAAVTLNTELTYTYRLGQFTLSIGLGPGYAHAFMTERTFRYEEGRFEEVTDFGSAVFMPSASFSASYQFGKRTNAPQAHMLIRQALDDPFANFPIPHAFIGGGVTLFPFAKRIARTSSTPQSN